MTALLSLIYLPQVGLGPLHLRVVLLDEDRVLIWLRIYQAALLRVDFLLLVLFKDLYLLFLRNWGLEPAGLPVELGQQSRLDSESIPIVALDDPVPDSRYVADSIVLLIFYWVA